MRFILVLIAGTALMASPGFAQQDDLGTAVAGLQSVLTNLKQSAEKLSVDNDQWRSKNKESEAQVIQLQARLSQLQAQGDDLTRSADRLHAENPGRARQIARLEKEKSDLDGRIQQGQNDIKSTQQSLDAQNKAYQQTAHSQKEKLVLMKMINDSQQRQALLRQSIETFKKGLEAQAAAAEDIKNPHQGDDAALLQMETDIKTLEQNYVQLKDLMAQMTRRSQHLQKAAGQRREERKLQDGLDGLERQNKQLRVQLESLSAKMVDLDKRKSRLEQMTR
ncbi:MAG: hypothetical protein KGK03_00630 [Candidatus Omnitrophica bacterium]|nr:hypothetical protein [Candidatus Omnitrophota bacterium]MDE2221559.1 hypothetical protein [Candidatus Omnitrophota bacterium]